MDTITMNGTQSATTEKFSETDRIIQASTQIDKLESLHGLDLDPLIRNYHIDKYEIIQPAQNNRDIKKSHVSKFLRELIDQDGALLDIKTNSDLVIIDGHHRWAALKQFHEQTGRRALFNLQIDGRASSYAIITQNKHNRAQSADDTIKMMARTKDLHHIHPFHKYYVVADNLLNNHKIRLSGQSLTILATSQWANQKLGSRAGARYLKRASVVHSEHILCFNEEQLIRDYEHIKKINDIMLNRGCDLLRTALVKAISVLLRDARYEPKRMEEKVSLASARAKHLEPVPTYYDDLKVALQKVYNYMARSGDRVEFFRAIDGYKYQYDGDKVNVFVFPELEEWANNRMESLKSNQ